MASKVGKYQFENIAQKLIKPGRLMDEVQHTYGILSYIGMIINLEFSLNRG